MTTAARFCIGIGGLALLVSVANQLSAPQPDPALQRSSVLASLLAVGLMLIGALWTRVIPAAAARQQRAGAAGCLLRSDLPAPLQAELDWGSRMLLEATPACVVLCWVSGQVWLRRGLMEESQQPHQFEPGAICAQARQKGRQIHLVDLSLYPGRSEFDALLTDLPSVIIQPLGADGLLLLGGWGPRCFGSSDQAWLRGWSERLRDQWVLPQAAAGLRQGLTAADAGSSSPTNQER